MYDISAAISLDPALVSKLMRIANSPLYARSRQVKSLNEAVIILGLNATIMLALSFTLTKSMRSSGEGGMDYALFWRRSLLAATAARAIAEKKNDVPSEDAFLAAMMHGIGAIALDKIQDSLPSSDTAFLQADIPNVSAWLLNEWRFPLHLVNAIRDSRVLDEVNRRVLGEVNRSTREIDLARCVRLAWMLVDAFLEGLPGSELEKVGHFAHSQWQVDAIWIGEVIDSFTGQLPEIESLFELKLVDETNLRALEAQAKDLLMTRSLHTAHALESSQREASRYAEKYDALKDLSARDPLTGLWNRTYFDRAIRRHFDMSDRNLPFAVVFIDLDHFKQINDTHGHHVGDNALKHAAQVLLDHTGSQDVVARYGGEEFLLLLPDVKTEAASLIARRLVRALRQSPMKLSSGQQLNMTASAGVSIHNDTHSFNTLEEMMRAADHVMYQAKVSGRDQSIVCSECL